jgi:tetratricopeptide (TPR) repeat protein
MDNTLRRMKPLTLTTMFIIVLGAFSSATAQEPDASTRQRKAREFFINGTTLQIQGNRHAEAILEFQQALRYDSSSVTLAAIARSYLELRKLDMASEYAQAAVERDSTSRDIWELIAEIEVLRGRYDEGIAAYERILELKPTKRQLYTLGRLYEPRNASKAIEIFERLVAMEPDESIYLRLADLYERKRNVKGVLNALERARALDPLDPQIAARTAELYVREGMIQELRALLTAWRGRDMDLDRSVRVWGVTLSAILEDTLVQGIYKDEIIVIIDEARAGFGTVWPITALAGTIAMRLDDRQRAASLFDLTTTSPDVRPESFLEIARVYLVHDDAASAESYLIRGRAKFPSDARIPFMLGGCAYELKRETEAITHYRDALGLDPTLADAWVQLGLLFDQRGESDSSDAAYERALALEPDHALANNNYAYSLAVRGIKLDRARSMSWRSVQADPTTAAYLDTYAWILYRSGEHERARTYIERAISVGGNATHYEHYGDILEALDDIGGAIRAWQNALQRDPDRTSVKLKLDRYR